MLKKILIIILLVIIGIGLYAYFEYFQTPEQQPQVQTTEKSIKKLTEESVISPVSSYDGDAIWFGVSSGKIMWFDLNDRVTSEYPIVRPLTEDFRRIYWPSTGNDFIAQGILAGSQKFNYYSYAQKVFTALPSNIMSLDWLRDGKRIVIVWKAEDGKVQLVTSNADASGYAVIRELPWADLVPKASPKDDSVLMYKNIPSGEVNKIYLFDLLNGDYREIVSEGQNSGVVWSPKGDKFAFIRNVKGQGKVFLHDMVTDVSTDTGLISSADKISFSNDGAILFVVSKNGTTEALTKIDITRGEKEELYDFGLNGSAKNIIAIGQKIYFIGLPEGKLYSIE